MTPRHIIEAGRLPGRKRPCIWLLSDNRIIPLAYFVSDDAFQVWMASNPTYSPEALRKAAAEESGGVS